MKYALLFLTLITFSYGISDEKLRTIQGISHALFQESNQSDSSLYFQSWRIDQRQGFRYAYSLGELLDSNTWDRDYLGVDSRVGSPSLDNTAPLKEHFGGEQSNHIQYLKLPIDWDSTLIHKKIQGLHQSSVQNAQYNFQIVQSNYELRPSEESSWYLSPRQAQMPPQSKAKTSVLEHPQFKGLDSLKSQLQRVSQLARQHPWIMYSNFQIEYESTIENYWDLEGIQTQQNQEVGRIQISLQTQAHDGMLLNHFKEIPLRANQPTPSQDSLKSLSSSLIKELEELRQAPIGQPYSGPVLLAPEAAAVFMHEVIGHRLESHRLKQNEDGQTFRKMLGQTIMDPQFNLQDDPTLKEYQGTLLNGHYLYDHQGVAAQSTTLVESGVLKGFLESRSSSSIHTHSNGHGRGNLHLPIASRMGNTILSTTRPLSQDSLLQLFRQQLKLQNKEFGYYFKHLSGGFTSTTKGMPQSFKLSPLMAWKVYVDQRPYELVRGVDLVGTPLVSLQKLLAASEVTSVFNGYCGAESGWVPVSSSAPGLLFTELEVENQYAAQVNPPPLFDAKRSTPPTWSDSSHFGFPDLQQGLKTLKLVDQAFKKLQSHHQKSEIQVKGIHANLWTNKTQEHLFENGYYSSKLKENFPELELQLYVGQDSLDQRFYNGNYIFESPLTKELPIRLAPTLTASFLNYYLEDLYINASEGFSQKKSYLNQNPKGTLTSYLAPKSDTLVDWRLCQSISIDSIKDQLSLLSQADSQFIESKLEIGNHNIQHFGIFNQRYSAQNICENTLVYSAAIKDSTGEVFWDYYRWSSSQFETIDWNEIKTGISQVKEHLQQTLKAPKVSFYRGPVVFQNRASGYFFHETFVESQMKLSENNHLEAPKPELLNLIDRKLMPSQFHVFDIPSIEMLNQTPLYGHYHFDHLGDSAEAIQIIDQGILKNLFSSRLNSLHHQLPGNGHYRYNDVWPGNLIINHSQSISPDSLFQTAIQLAEEEGLSQFLIIDAFEEHDALGILDKQLQGQVSESFTSSQDQGISFKNPTRMYWYDIKTGQITIARPLSLLPITFNDLRLIQASSTRKTLIQPYAAYSLYSPDFVIELLNLRTRPTQWKP